MRFSIILECDTEYRLQKKSNLGIDRYKLYNDKVENLTLGDINNKWNVVIMDDDAPNNYLKNRFNIVLSKCQIPTHIDNLNNLEYIQNNFLYFNNINYLLIYLNTIKGLVNECFVIGGNNIFTIFLDLQLIKSIYLTIISKINYNSNIYFNFQKYKKRFNLDILEIYDDYIPDSNRVYKLMFYVYSYINKEETKFIKTVNKILEKGAYSIDRSGVGTLSTFGKTFTYDIRNYRLPLFTHRKIFLRGIIEELLFFISGRTDTKILENKNINIWKGHTSRAFLDSRNLHHLQEGDMGAGYGFQLRHFGGEYTDAKTNYHGIGFDQLSYVINEIKNNPSSRRILFSYWNPMDFDRTSLLPCHILYQFNVNVETNELSCSFYQRSSDFCLAACFNICSAAILVFMICHLTNLKPGKIIHNIGNVHIYMNQIEIVKDMITNKPYNFPLLLINDIHEEIKNIEDFRYEHFQLLFYQSYKKYNISMSV